MRGHTSFLVCIIHFSSPWIAKPDEVCKLFHHGFTKSHLFPFLRGSFSHPVSFWQSVFFHQLPYFFFPCYWNLTDAGFDIQYFIPSLLIASFFNIVQQNVCFVKDRGTCSSRERNIKISASSSEVTEFSLTSPLSQVWWDIVQQNWSSLHSPRDLW